MFLYTLESFPSSIKIVYIYVTKFPRFSIPFLTCILCVHKYDSRGIRVDVNTSIFLVRDVQELLTFLGIILNSPKDMNNPQFTKNVNNPQFTKNMNNLQFTKNMNNLQFTKNMNNPQFTKNMNNPQFTKNMNNPQFSNESAKRFVFLFQEWNVDNCRLFMRTMS